MRSIRLTGALGLMMTVGGKGPCLEGVPAPLGDWLPAEAPNLSGIPAPCAGVWPDP